MLCIGGVYFVLKKVPFMRNESMANLKNVPGSVFGFLFCMVFSTPFAVAEVKGHGVDVEWGALSKNRGYFGVLHPVESPVKLGTFLQWKLHISDRDGKPVKNARIRVSGGMKGHLHGLPSQPVILKGSEDGWYIVDGLKFSMAGKWQLEFAIQQGSVRDLLEIPIELNY